MCQKFLTTWNSQKLPIKKQQITARDFVCKPHSFNYDAIWRHVKDGLRSQLSSFFSVELWEFLKALIVQLYFFNTSEVVFSPPKMEDKINFRLLLIILFCLTAKNSNSIYFFALDTNYRFKIGNSPHVYLLPFLLINFGRRNWIKHK